MIVFVCCGITLLPVKVGEPMKLSLSGFLFEDNCETQSIGFAEFCRIARAAGYDGVELRRTQVNPDTPVRERRELLRTVEDHGLVVTCLTARGLPAGGAERDDFFGRCLDLCADMGCGLMKIGGDPAWCGQAAERARERGVSLASNNHAGGPLETVDGTRAFLRYVDHPGFGLLYDCLHLRVAGEDYIGCIPEFTPVTLNILVHSARLASEQEPALLVSDGRRWARALPGEAGVQDWPAVFAAFQDRGYDGLVTVIENGWPVAQREHVARACASALRSFMGDDKP